jgi:hypothetical protein
MGCSAARREGIKVGFHPFATAHGFVSESHVDVHAVVSTKAAVLVVALSLSTAAAALDRKHLDGSVSVAPDRAALAFVKRYEQAINSKSTSEFVALLHPASRECYERSKHPEYYREEFGKWFELKIDSLKDFREFKPGFDADFYRLMKYPKPPTHIAEFNSEAMVGSRMGRGWHSIEIIKENDRYFLAYRCM